MACLKIDNIRVENMFVGDVDDSDDTPSPPEPETCDDCSDDDCSCGDVPPWPPELP